MPLDLLILKLRDAPDRVRESAASLAHNRLMVVGVGLERWDRSPRSWVYFPQRAQPFYRVTYLSNYADANVPDVSRHFSFLAEISLGTDEFISESSALKSTIDGFENAGMINASDKNFIRSTFVHEINYAYPIPTLTRDDNLSIIQEFLEQNDIYSRGRFGAWLYESGNMDHSYCQGSEVVRRILRNIDTIHGSNVS
jgi:hypothetical protein